MMEMLVRHRTAANLLMLLFLAAGVYALPQLRRETFPDFAASEVEIRIAYPGATAADVEEAICRRVEDALDGVKFVKELRSDAREGLAVFTAEMENTGHLATFQNDLETEVKAITDFPDNVEDAIIRQLGQTDVVMVLLAAGPMSAGDLKVYCEQLKDRLQELPEVSLVALEGFSDRQFRVELSREKLRRYGLSVDQVAKLISRQSLSVPAGVVETGDSDILIRFVEERRSVTEIEDVVLTGVVGGAEIRVRDVGHVIDTFENPEEKNLLGQRRAGVLRIEKTKDEDIIRVAQAVRFFVQSERERHPQIELKITQDGSTLVQQRLDMLVTNGWQGMLLVFIAMWVFFNVRLSFWVVMSLPVSFMGAFFFLPMLGLTINMMTMVAFLLALGLLMDDGIVIAENIASHRAQGKPAMQSAVDGMREVSSGVLSSFLTTVCVLGPLAQLSGFIGKVLEVIPMVLILVMAISLVEAFCILPAHLGHALHHVDGKSVGAIRQRVDAAVEWLRERVVGRLLDRLLRWRYLFVGCVVGVFCITLGLFTSGVVGFQGFPDLEGDVVVARILLPQGTPLNKTEAVIRRLTDSLDRINERFADDQPQGKELLETVNVQFNRNQDAFEFGAHVATISVDLLTSEQRSLTVDEFVSAWRTEIGQLPDVISLTFGEPGFGPAGRPIEIRFQGENLTELKRAAGEAQAWFADFAGVSNLTDDIRPGKQEVRIRLKAGAVGLGLDASAMAGQLQAAFQGATANDIQVGPEQYEIDVQFQASDQDSLADLDDFAFVLADGGQIPLSAVADMELSRGWARIGHINGKRTVTLIGDIDPKVTNTIALIQKFEQEKLPEIAEQHPGVGVLIEGESQEAAITNASMRRAMVIGLLGMFLLLSFQFESWLEPLVVMVTIPLALIGVILGHLIMGLNMSMPSLLGFVSLSGVVVNDSILLVLFLKKASADGADILESAAQASRLRFRAIMLTSVTTIAGLVPLLFETSLQAQVLIPLAVSITFGLLASTVLVLLVIPCLYVMLHDHIAL
ncbi:MAG: efflux RND transporter permease subunit [Planctomycetota bacterium]|nr:efflux RND transporter permease subunit [Planctomycetota bacterium]